MIVDTIGLKKSRLLLKVLLDPGSTKTLISCKALPRGTSATPLQEANMGKALAGTMKAAKMLHLRNLYCPNLIRIDKLMSRKLFSLKINADMMSF